MDDLQALIEGLEPYKNADPKEKLGMLRSQVRAPLTTVLGFAEISQIKLSQVELPEELKDLPRFLDQILDAARKIDKTIEIMTTQVKSDSST